MSATFEGHRVLFVDDAVDLLDGLRNGLRRERHGWRMRFAQGGEQALRMLAEEPADVVVSDMRMPGMEGLELLRCVQERWPASMRVILSGQADLATVIAASAVAHQYLAKPCDLGVLRGVVRHGFETRARIASAELRQVLGGVRSLPLDPAVGERLRAGLSGEPIDLRALAAEAENDAAVASRLLQFANSPYCDLPSRVLSVEGAVRFLGPQTVGQLLRTLEPVAGRDDGRPCPGDAIPIRRARLAARLTRRIAPGHPDGAAAFVAALLHAVGECVLVTRMTARWEELSRVARETSRPVEEVERERLGVDHHRMGSYLLALWGFPGEVVEVVDRVGGCADDAGQPSELLQLVRCAVGLAAEALGGEGSPAPEDAAAAAGAAGSRLDEWRRMAAEEARQLATASPTRPS